MVTRQQRRRQLAREKWERQQSRRQERRHKARRRAIIAGAVAGVLAVSAGGYGLVALMGDDPEPTSAASSPSPSAGPTAPRPTKAGECTYVSQPGDDQKPVGKPTEKAPLQDAVATITTSRGTVTAELFGETAACAVHSFRFLAGKNAFDNTVCTEVALQPAKARYLQCGDPTGSGAGGPGYIFGNENDDKSTIEPGWLVMADGENRNGSRFLVTHQKSTFDTPVTVFGKVSKGLDVVRKVAEGGIAEGSSVEGVGRPKTSVIIEDVKVTTK